MCGEGDCFCACVCGCGHVCVSSCVVVPSILVKVHGPAATGQLRESCLCTSTTAAGMRCYLQHCLLLCAAVHMHLYPLPGMCPHTQIYATPTCHPFLSQCQHVIPFLTHLIVIQHVM